MTRTSTTRCATYLLEGFALSLLVATALPTAFGLGIGLLPVFGLGLLFLALTVLGAEALARTERRRAALILGAELPVPPARAVAAGAGLVSRWQARLSDPMTWRELGWATLVALFGVVPGSLLLALGTAALAGVLAPLAALLAPGAPLLASTPWVILWPVAGLACAALIVPAARGLAAGYALSARAILTPSPAALAARVATLESTRAGAVESADATMRRIERDLHDGAQHRLAYVAMELGRARTKFDEDPEGARDLLERAHSESKRAMVELRDLVRGVHPSVLADRGLAAAISGVAARSRVPVTSSVRVEPRPGRAAEAAAYFVVAEALANVGRHAGARHADVEITRQHDRLEVVVADDGRGGALAEGGGGLAGLRQRVEALDGTFGVISNPGEGTTVWAELPCGS